MTLCPICIKRNECKEICSALKKEISGRGITALPKPKTYTVDFSHIEDTHQPLNPFQVEVLSTIARITSNTKKEIITRLDLGEAIDNSLNNKEKEVILLFMQSFKQQEIAQKINISQPRVNFLLQRAFRKLRNYIMQL